MERKMQLHIPNEIFDEILLRLPTKSLLRLRWSCKYWFDLITRDQVFINMHLNHSTTTNHDDGFFSPIPIVLRTRYPQISFQCHLNLSNATSYISSEVSVGVPCKTGSVVLGSCNGLILLYRCEDTKLCIWNPCTKEYIILPLPFPFPFPAVWPPWWQHNYGFGYADDYKIILLNRFNSNVQVYTLGTNSWRRIEYNHYPYRLRTRPRDLLGGVFMNEALYWMDSLYENIISFDINKEKFQHVSKLPNVTDNVISWHYSRLQVFEGSLCVVLKIEEQQNNRAEMWVMGDYSENNNKKKNAFLWRNLLTIPNLSDIMFPIKVLRYARNGELLMLNRYKEFKLYDPKSSQDRTLCRLPDVLIREIQVYTESLVRLNSGTYMGQEQREEQKKNNN